MFCSVWSANSNPSSSSSYFAGDQLVFPKWVVAGMTGMPSRTTMWCSFVALLVSLSVLCLEKPAPWGIRHYSLWDVWEKIGVFCWRFLCLTTHSASPPSLVLVKLEAWPPVPNAGKIRGLVVAYLFGAWAFTYRRFFTLVALFKMFSALDQIVDFWQGC